MDTVDEIKSRLSIYDVVSGYVKLKKAGKNYKGNCPFHQEKTPSFIVSPDKDICYCFGCKQGGDVFEFIKLMERVDFKEALELLADKVGIEIKKSPHHKKNKEQKEKIKNIYREVSSFYQQCLKKNEKAREYIKQRKINDLCAKTFELGYAPDSFESTYSHLLEKGFTRKEIIDAGLCVQKEISNDKIYDRFRDRLMFPLCNTQGNIVAFAARILDKGEPKYLNSPETLLYKKGQFLYGLDKAKESIKIEDEVIVVEGNMDVVRSYQTGVKHVVASSGTALTREQIKMLKRFTSNIIFCFDADKAGKEASKRAIHEAMAEEVKIYLLAFPENAKDPDEIIEKEGEKAWREISKKKINFMDQLIDSSFLQYDPYTVEGKAKICELILPFLSKIQSAVEQDHYLRICSERMKVNTKNLLTDMKRYHATSQGKVKNKPAVKEKTERLSFEEHLLGLIITYPQFFEDVDKIIDEKIYRDKKTEKFYKHVKNLYNREELLSFEKIVKNLIREEKEYLSILSVYADEKFCDIGEKVIQEAMITTAKRINRGNLIHYIQDIKDPEEMKQKMQEVKAMLSKLS